MKKIVKAILLPSPSCATWIWKDGKDMFYTGKDMPNSNQLYQQLLVLSDDEVTIGQIGKKVKYPWGIGKTVEHQGNHGIEVECIKCTLTNNHSNVTKGTKARFSSTDVKWILASYPQIEGTLPISQEFMQQYVQSQGEGVVYIETEEKCVDVTEPVRKYYNETTWIEIPKLDKAGNAVLSIEQEVKPVVPTDDEIEKKAKEYCKTNTHIEKRVWYFASKNYKAGYKQALKDLGYE